MMDKMYGQGYNTTDACVPQMEPLTSQLGSRISESNAMLQELVARLYKVTEKLLGPEGKLREVPSEMISKSQLESVPQGMLDKLLRESKLVNVKLVEVENLIRRLESL